MHASIRSGSTLAFLAQLSLGCGTAGSSLNVPSAASGTASGTSGGSAGSGKASGVRRGSVAASGSSATSIGSGASEERDVQQDAGSTNHPHDAATHGD